MQNQKNWLGMGRRTYNRIQTERRGCGWGQYSRHVVGRV